MTRKGTPEEQEQRDRFTKLRSILRRAWMRDTERAACIRESRIPYVGENKRQKWVYKCAECKQLFKDKQLVIGADGKKKYKALIVVDHIIPCGTFLEPKDFITFYPALFCSRTQLQVLCKLCHNIKTAEERKSK